MNWYDTVMSRPGANENLLAWDNEEHVRCCAIERCLQETGWYWKRFINSAEQEHYDLLALELRWRVGMGVAMRPTINKLKEIPQ